MKLNRITIKGTVAHFKIPLNCKIQQTYNVPPISSIYGILKNIYGEGINDFTLGYTMSFENKTRDIMSIKKEFDLSKKTVTDKERFMNDTCIVEYLHNVELVIYTNINSKIILNDILVLGKANCLGTITEIKEVKLKDIKGIGKNQLCPKHIGKGQIKRLNTITKYNENTDMYDYKSNLFRVNDEFEYDKNLDEELENNIILWNWKEGVVSEVN